MPYFSNYRFDISEDKFLNKEDHRLFKLSLILFDNIYFWSDPSPILWNALDYKYASQDFHLPRKYLKKKKYNFEDMKSCKSDYFKPLFAFNPLIFDDLSKNVNSVQNLDPDSYFIKQIILMAKQNKFPSPALYEACFNILIQANGNEYRLFEYEINNQRHGRIENMMWDFFLTAYLDKHYKISSIFTANELFALNALRKMNSFPLWSSPNKNIKPQSHPFTKEIGCYTSHGLVKRILGTNSSPEMIGSVIIPDIAELPIYEISNFIKKEKHKPIVNELKALLKKYKGQISRADLANELVTRYIALTSILAPGISSVSVGILGNIPSPTIINPIGLFGAMTEAKKFLKVKEEHSFLLSVNNLHELYQEHNAK